MRVHKHSIKRVSRQNQGVRIRYLIDRIRGYVIRNSEKLDPVPDTNLDVAICKDIFRCFLLNTFCRNIYKKICNKRFSDDSMDFLHQDPVPDWPIYTGPGSGS